MAKETKKPKHKFRLGSLQTAIWENKGEKGNFDTCGGIKRSYKVGEEWKTTDTLRQSDIDDAIRLLQKVKETMKELKETEGVGE